jgi:mannose/cellobiose epimerase-like protein (N-acyl-D-glucosamine 2-epimerase family)
MPTDPTSPYCRNAEPQDMSHSNRRSGVENDDFVSSEGPAWKSRVGHRRWLREQADALFNFFESRCVCPSGGFFELDPAGRPLHFSNPVRAIHGTARMVHSYTIASLLGRPGADAIVDHGMRFLWEKHRDGRHGGYFWSVDDRGPIDATKQGYGHAFVLLAASSARTIGHPLADAMIADVTGVLETKFWEPAVASSQRSSVLIGRHLAPIVARTPTCT